MRYETLHLCHSIDQKKLNEYIHIIGDNDAVVFYQNKMNYSQYDKITETLKFHKIYFVLDYNKSCLPSLTYDDWLDLVNKYNKTLTWK